MSLASLMNVEASVLGLAQAQSQTMGANRAWTAAGRSVRGRFENTDSRVVEQFRQQDLVVTHTWFFCVDPLLLPLTSGLEYGGERYEVQNVENVANMNRMWEVQTRKLRAQPL